jgi:hypothetical protein
MSRSGSLVVEPGFVNDERLAGFLTGSFSVAVFVFVFTGVPEFGVPEGLGGAVAEVNASCVEPGAEAAVAGLLFLARFLGTKASDILFSTAENYVSEMPAGAEGLKPSDHVVFHSPPQNLNFPLPKCQSAPRRLRLSRPQTMARPTQRSPLPDPSVK